MKQLRRMLDTPVYSKDSAAAAPAVGETGGGEALAHNWEAEIAAETHHLKIALLQRSWQRVEQDAAYQKTAAQARRILLWTSLVIGIAVQLGLLTWLGWEITHPVSHPDLILPVASNVLSGSAGAYTARRFIKGRSAWSAVTPAEEEAAQVLSGIQIP